MFVQTVRGPVNPDEIGFTLPAEHFYIKLWHLPGREALWQLEDDDVFAGEVHGFKEHGGSCIVDTTPACMGRKPERLKAMSERTGVHIVMATGWYTEAYLPPEDRVDITYASALADRLIQEIHNGVGSTDIRPGVIGEFGPTGDRISPAEERIHRASARAHRATGIALVTHAMHSEVGLDQLDLLEEEGVDLTKVAIGHCDSWPFLEYWRRIAERGAFVLLDNIGTEMGRHEDRLASLVRAMVDKGYERNLLLSHDMGTAAELRYYGGRGFVHLAESFLPRLRNLGIPDSVLNTITMENPRRLLAVDVQE